MPLVTIRLLKQPRRSRNAIVGLQDGADMTIVLINVRFRGQSGHQSHDIAEHLP
jgi:hypothetical protein